MGYILEYGAHHQKIPQDWRDWRLLHYMYFLSDLFLEVKWMLIQSSATLNLIFATHTTPIHALLVVWTDFSNKTFDQRLDCIACFPSCRTSRHPICISMDKVVYCPFWLRRAYRRLTKFSEIREVNPQCRTRIEESTFGSSSQHVSLCWQVLCHLRAPTLLSTAFAIRGFQRDPMYRLR